MQFSDSIKYKTFVKGTDEDGYATEEETWVDLGKCTIFPNTASQKQVSEDVEQRVYSYEVVMRKPKTYLPKEGDWIHLTKKDASIDEDVQVIGFVTLKGRFLKLWV